MSNILYFITNLTLDSVLKISQICFYIVAGSIAVLTFIKAKNGLLNSVNTEYQKKVIERLVEVSHEFREHFDEESPHYWLNDKSVKYFVDEVNNAFQDGPYLEYDDEYPYGYPSTAMALRIRYLLEKVKTDPLIPSSIRKAIFDTLDHITYIREAVYHQALDEYYEYIKQGGELYDTESGRDLQYERFHNRIVHLLVDNDCGISEMDHRMAYINEIIQVYLESFNPVNRAVKLKPYAPLKPQPMRVVEIRKGNLDVND